MKKYLLILLVSFQGILLAQETYVPDLNFEMYLENYGMGNGIIGDQYVTTANIETVTSLSISDLDIADLTGIQDFRDLLNLYCYNNLLTSLDLSQNTQLNHLNFNNNDISSIDLSQNTQLTYLNCSMNNLSTLDVSQNTQLTNIYCSNNNLASLDIGNMSDLSALWCEYNILTTLNVSNCPSLSSVRCRSNQISILDFSNNPALTQLYCWENIVLSEIDFTNGTNTNITNANFGVTNEHLTCIYVDDPAWSEANWTQIGSNTHFLASGDMATCEMYQATTYIPDANFENYLETHTADGGTNGDFIGNGIPGDHLVYTYNIDNLTILNISNKGISDLTGIQDFTNLAELYCSYNDFTSIDLTQNTQLTKFFCDTNSLTTLDLTQNTQLVELNLSDSPLATLDLSQNTLISILRCINTQIYELDLHDNTALTLVYVEGNSSLASLDIRNGNNINISEMNFFAIDCPNLICIYVDDSQWSAENWSQQNFNSHYVETDAECDFFHQTTNIPDPNFEQALIDLSLDDSIDGKVWTSFIYQKTFLNIANKNIQDLTGIQDFIALNHLRCEQNQLETLDLNQNTDLEFLDCFQNELSSLNLGTNTSFVSINCSANNLTAINLDSFIDLNYLTCDNNQLTSIDATDCTLDEFIANDNQLTFVDLRNGYNYYIDNADFSLENNPDLLCIYVDSVNNTWSAIDSQSLFVESEAECDLYGQQTLIPDANFEQALINYGYDDVIDGQVLTTNIYHVSDLSLGDQEISDLTGIQDFLNLEHLYCATNNLTSIDLSQNTALDYLNLNSNTFTSIDLSQNTALTYLNLDYNLLTSINVSQNPALTYFSCNSNALTVADIRNGNNTNLSNSDFRLNSNPDLICIYVDDVVWSEANWSLANTSSHFVADEAECEYYTDTTYIPDDNFEQALIDLGYDNVLDDYVYSFDIIDIANLEVNGLEISDLTGIEAFSSLEILNCSTNQIVSIDLSSNIMLTDLLCSDNQLEALDLSQNTVLESLYCENNQLASLNVSSSSNTLMVLYASHNQLTDLVLGANTVLSILECKNNQITSLDISANTSISYLECRLNQLTFLDVRNGNNINFNEFYAQSNPDLSCIYVDDADYSDSNWSNIDPDCFFVEDTASCEYYTAQTYVPDDNFEIAVAEFLGIDDLIDDYIPTYLISDLQYLDISNRNIADLTGIQDFLGLEHLNCTDNQLGVLDLSNNVALKTLYCSNNQLTNVDVSSCILLEEFDGINNQLTSLDVSQNLALRTLNCYNNQLTALDISQNPDLEAVGVNNNQLTNLILGTSSAPMMQIDCSENLLTDIDISQLADVEFLDCSNNQLASLDTRNGNTMLFVDLLNNPDLYCVFVDDVVQAEDQWAYNPMVHFVPDQTACDYLDTHTFVPDDNFEQALIDLGYDDVIDDYVLTNTINQIAVLDVSDKEIADLRGIEDFTALTNLSCHTNFITDLYLIYNTLLEVLDCSSNDLSVLDIRNGNNSNITSFNALNNYPLPCIYVDDVVYSETNWINIDSDSYFVANESECQFFTTHTYIPDDNFEQELIDQGYDDVLDDYVLTSTIESLSTLEVPGKNISDLTGIQDFTALIGLDCSTNNLTELDVSAISLMGLDCHNNAITSLDFSNNSSLIAFDGHANQLTFLDLRNGNNSSMSDSYYDTTENPDLTCIFVDDVAYSTATWTQVDVNSHFVTNQAECENVLDIDNYVLNSIEYYPNPIVDYISIKASQDISDIAIFSILGKKVKELKPNNNLISIDFSNLSSGIYIIRIQMSGNISKPIKVIKK